MQSAWDKERVALEREVEALREAGAEDAARETARDSGVARRISELEQSAEEAAVAAAEEKRVYAERYAALSADFEASAERCLELETLCKKLRDDVEASEKRELASKEVNDRLTDRRRRRGQRVGGDCQAAELARPSPQGDDARPEPGARSRAEVASAARGAKAEQAAAAARVEAAERRRADARGETEGSKRTAGKKAKIDSLEAEVKELRAKETDAVKECGSLRAEIARLEAGSAARTRADDENKIKSEMYATQEAETLKVKLAEANALNDRLQKQVQRAEAAKDDAELERESLREGINKTARENRALTARVAHLEAQDASHEREKNEALREAAAARADAEASSSSAAQASSARAAAELRAEELRDQLRSARGDVTSAAAAALEMERHMGSAQRAAAESAMKLKTHSAGKELVSLRLREKTQELSDMAETLREERAKRREERETIAAEKETLRVKLAALERRLRTEPRAGDARRAGRRDGEVAKMSLSARDRGARGEGGGRAQRLHQRLFPDAAAGGRPDDLPPTR